MLLAVRREAFGEIIVVPIAVGSLVCPDLRQRGHNVTPAFGKFTTSQKMAFLEVLREFDSFY